MTEPVDPNTPMPYPPPPPPWGGSPVGTPGYAALAPLVDEDPKARRRRRLIIGAVVVVLAAGLVAGALALFAGDDTPPKPVPLPEAFGAYVRTHDATAERIENGVAKSLRTQKEGSRLLKSASIATYARQGSSAIALVALVLPSSIAGGNADDITLKLLNITQSNSGYEQIGPHGGSSRCIGASVGGATIPACAWRDSHTTGVLLSFALVFSGSGPTPHQLNAVALALRDAVD